MVIETLAGEQSPALFIGEYYLRRPYSQPGTAAAFRELGSWETVRQILADGDADVLIARQGQRWPDTGVPPFEQLRALHDEGYTVLVRHAERHHAGLARLAEQFCQDLQAEVDVHIYCTPPQEHGFGWHYDAEDVFILQTEGSKEYSLRKNTVNPWPLVETLPRDMRYEREVMPLMKCLLEAGDWLYIPHGYWHVARAVRPSISLAVGVLAPSGMDVFDHLRERLLTSPLWRQRLPPAGTASTLGAEALEARYRELFAQLAEDATRMLTDESSVRSFLLARERKFEREAPPEPGP